MCSIDSMKTIQTQENKTEREITSIIDGMYENILSGEVNEVDAFDDALDLIKQEIGYVERS